MPFSLYETGLVLGSIILFIVCLISIIASTFIIEVLAIQNCLRKYEKEVVCRASRLSHSLDSASVYSCAILEPRKSPFTEDFKARYNTPVYSEETTKNGVLAPDTPDCKHSLINDQIADKNMLKEDLIKNQETVNPSQTSLEEELNDEYYICERYEISKLSNQIFDKFSYFLITIVLVGYLYVGLTSNGIIVGNSLVNILPQTFNVDITEAFYPYIAMIFYILTMMVSLNNINKLKAFGMLIMCLRLILIIFIFVLCFHTMATKTGIAPIKDIPLFDFSNITIMIGNSLFFFMSHHSIPGMVENFYPQKSLIKLLFIGYFTSLIVMILYGTVALFTFAQVKDCDITKFPCAIRVCL